MITEHSNTIATQSFVQPGISYAQAIRPNNHQLQFSNSINQAITTQQNTNTDRTQRNYSKLVEQMNTIMNLMMLK